MKKLKKYTYVLGLAIAALTTVACEDQSEEITSIEYSRYFAPINLEARVQNRTDVRLTWTPSQGATSYNIEVFANDSLTFAGTAALTFNGITEQDVPYVITGLDGETKYSARVQTVGEDANKASKWSGVFFETSTEQSLQAVTEADLTYNSVTLRWTAGLPATEIVITPADVPAHVLTAEEIAAGQATITGLKSETEYTAKLMNGEKTRGTQTFTTLIDLAGAIAIEPDDDFVAMLEGAQDGDAFAFYPGTYTVPDEEGGVGKINISASIELKAVRPSDRPIINGCITLNEGASLSLSQIIMDGTGTDGSQAFDFKDEGTYEKLIIDDCEIRNYVKGFFYLNVAASVGEITINNSLLHGIVCDGGDMFDNRRGHIGALNLTSSTIWNSCAERDFVRMDGSDNGNTLDDGRSTNITIDHCTIDGVSNSSSRRLFYVRFGNNGITFTNNMVSNMPNCGRGFSDNGNTAEPTFENNNYFNTKNLVSDGGDGKAKFFDTEGTTLDPGYANAAEGDFTVGNEDLNYNGVGDPRWITEN